MGRLFKAGPKMYWGGRTEQVGPKTYMHHPYWPTRSTSGDVTDIGPTYTFDRLISEGWWVEVIPTHLLLPEGV